LRGIKIFFASGKISVLPKKTKLLLCPEIDKEVKRGGFHPGEDIQLPRNFTIATTLKL
jgi:hypothetical protein